jgi:plasmid stability protein
MQSLIAHSPIMASITIRNLDDALKARLRLRAARRGRSMEEEAREILRAALNEQHGERRDLASVIRRRMAPFGGVDLPEVERDSPRGAPELEG